MHPHATPTQACLYSPLSPAVQNERQPRNTAQVREDQIERELEGHPLPSNATVSATHPAFSPTANHRFMTGLMPAEPATAKHDSDEAGRRASTYVHTNPVNNLSLIHI